MSCATTGDCIKVGSFSTGGSTFMKVCAVYDGRYLKSKNQLPPPKQKPNIVSSRIIIQCRRSMAIISRGVMPPGVVRTAIAGREAIILGSPANGFCPVSTICYSIPKLTHQSEDLQASVGFSQFYYHFFSLPLLFSSRSIAASIRSLVAF